MPTETKCKICNVVVATKQEQIEHEFSLMHHIKLDQDKKKKQHFCSLCSVPVGALKNYSAHLNGSKHIKMLEWQRHQWKKRPPNDADVPIVPIINVIDDDENESNISKEKSKKIGSLKKNNVLTSKASSRTVVPKSREANNVRKSQKDAPLLPTRDDVSSAADNVNIQHEDYSFRRHANYNVSQDSRPIWQQDCWFMPPFEPNRPRILPPFDLSRPPPRFPPYLNTAFCWRSSQQTSWRFPHSTPHHSSHNRFWVNRHEEQQSANANTENRKYAKQTGDGLGSNGIESGTRRSEKTNDSSFGSCGATKNNSRNTDNRRPSLDQRNDRESKRIDRDRHGHYTTRHDRSRDYSASSSKSYSQLRNEPFVNRNDWKRHSYEPKDRTDSLKISGHCVDNIKVTVQRKSYMEVGKDQAYVHSEKRPRERCSPSRQCADIRVTAPSKSSSDVRQDRDVQPAKNISPGKENAHTFFLSSDDNGDDDESDVVCSPPRKRRSCDKSGDEISSCSKDLINKLVNFPRTRKQQLQLGKWIQEHARSKKRLILPRFNLQLASTSVEKDEDSVVENMVCEVVDNLPENVIKELVEVLNSDFDQHAAEDDSAVLPPWLHFLKSLSRAPSPSAPTAVLEVLAEQEAAVQADVSNEVEDVTVLPQPVPTVIVKTEPIDVEESSAIAVGNCTAENDSVAIPQQNEEPTMCPEAMSEVVLTPILQQIKTEPPDPPTENNSETVHAESEQRVSTPSPTTAEETQHLEQLCVESLQIPSSEEQNDHTVLPPEPPVHVPSVNASPLGHLSPRVSESGTPVPAVVENAEEKKLEEKVGLLQQGIVTQLVDISRKEENLREELQDIDHQITKAQKTLAGLISKRKGMQREELELRTQRLNLLEVLQGSMSSVQASSHILDDIEQINPALQVLAAQNNLTYLGTVDNLQQLGSCHIQSSKSSTASPTNRKKTAGIKKVSRPKKTQKAKKNDKKGKQVGTNKRKLTKKKREKVLAEDAAFINSMPTPESLECQDGDSIPDPKINELIQNLFADATDKTLPTSSDTHMRDENENRMPGVSTSDNDESNICSFEAHNSAIIDLKMVGEFLYTCSTDMLAKRWDMKNQAASIHYRGHSKTVSALQVTTLEGDKAFVYTSSHDGFLRCFEAWSGVCLNEFDAGQPIICMAKAWGKLFLGMNNGTIVPFSITSNRFLEAIHCSHSAISKVVATSEGTQRLLCVASYDETVSVRNASTGLLLRYLEGKIKPPSFMQVFGNYIYTTTAEQKIVTHDLSTGRLYRAIRCQSSCTGLCISGDFVFTCAYDGLIRCYRKKSWMLHALFYGAGKSMIMCMEISNSQIYTGNRRGFLEGFLFDPNVIVSCRFQKCNFPFGRAVDLSHHVEHDHLPSISSTAKECPWADCSVKLSTNDLKEHVLKHCIST